jgi:hypothetical protein
MKPKRRETMKTKLAMVGIIIGLIGGTASRLAEPSLPGPAADGFQDLLRAPDAVTAVTTEGTFDLAAGAGGWTGGGIEITAAIVDGGLRVDLLARKAAVKSLTLR